ncbi:unnamed protein product [Meganyctiphanes norvegica]|uniref:Uncharacterized protein n=1 Tax=Meganyctiphanes norvegica TaxID=48144 RepID=A0AAV2Q0Z7_MEGNR
MYSAGYSENGRDYSENGRDYSENGRRRIVDTTWYNSEMPNKVSKRMNPHFSKEQKYMIVWLWLFGFLVMVIIIYVTSGPPIFRPVRPQLSPIQMMIPASFNANRTLAWWDGDETCACNATGCISHPDTPLDGTCSRRAWAAGFEQNVVSLTVQGSLQPYETLLKRTLENVTTLYPGFFVRLYTDPENNKEVLCPLLKKFQILHVCNIQRLPEPLGNISSLHAGLWNLAPMGDQQVKLLLVRDFGAEILEREVYAVQEWMKLNATLHVMRDHPLHNYEIVSGLFDIRSDLNILPQIKKPPSNKDTEVVSQNTNQLEVKVDSVTQGVETIEMWKYLANIRDEMFIQARENTEEGYDQAVLQVLLWPPLAHDVVGHDSYTCSRYLGSRPWPTRRKNNTFVGNFSYRSTDNNWKITNGLECPLECRPKLNPDWSTC